MAPLRHSSRPDRGFTLIEIMVTVAIMSVLFGLAVGSWRSWALAEDHKGASNSIQSTLRNAQVRAVTEGISMCVRFDTAASTYTLYRYACDDTAPDKLKGPMRVNDARVHIKFPQFTAPDGTLHEGVTFRPSGSAWPGSVKVTRENSTKEYTLNVEGFTGRVFVS